MHSSESTPVRSALERTLQLIRATDESHSEWLKNYVRDHFERFQDDLSLLIKTTETDRLVVDVGSTPPVFTVASALLGYRVVGVDLSPGRISFPEMTQSIEILSCNIEQEELPIEDGRAGCIMLSEVFEHLRFNPPKLLRGLRKKLQADGVLILTTPNLYSARGLKNFVKNGRAEVLCSKPHLEYKKLETLGHMGHVREYTLKEMRETLINSGFEIVEIQHREYLVGLSHIEAAMVRLFPQLSSSVAFVCRPAARNS